MTPPSVKGDKPKSFLQTKPKQAVNVLVGRKQTNVSSNNHNGTSAGKTQSVAQAQPKRRLEPGQVWDERLCNICKDAGKAESVYKSHNQDTCRSVIKKVKFTNEKK